MPSGSASEVAPPTVPPTTTAAATQPNVPTGPQRSVVTFYRTDDVIRGQSQPFKRLEVNVPLYGMVFGPDPRWAIVSVAGERAPLRVLDVDSGMITSFALGLPADALHQRSLVLWLPDGRLLLTGREIWVGGPRGEDLRSVFARFPFEVAPSPSGKLLAIVTLGSSAIIVLDLASGETTTLTGPFRPCAQDGGVGIVWAPDETAVAATDCSDQPQGGTQTRVVRVAEGREIRTLAELRIVAWLRSGDIIASGHFRPRAEPELWVVGISGSRRSLSPVGLYLSPDERFLLGDVIRDAPTSADPARRAHFVQLVEVTTGRLFEVGEGMPAGWTARGDILLVSLF